MDSTDPFKRSRRISRSPPKDLNENRSGKNTNENFDRQTTPGDTNSRQKEVKTNDTNEAVATAQILIRMVTTDLRATHT